MKNGSKQNKNSSLEFDAGFILGSDFGFALRCDLGFNLGSALRFDLRFDLGFNLRLLYHTMLPNKHVLEQARLADLGEPIRVGGMLSPIA